MKNRRGMISLDFIFALVLVLGFTSILFALSLTLTMADVTQYITFASARNYFAAHINPQKQTDLAKAKYLQLLDNNVFKRLYTNGWFVVDQNPVIGNVANVRRDFNIDPDHNHFIGTGTTFTAKMLDFNIPLWGSTNPADDGGAGFNTFIGSYLGREVTSSECMQFVRDRWEQIRMLPAKPGVSPYNMAEEQGYYAYDDNGC